MVNIKEEGIIDYNPCIYLITPALIGHTDCVNWEERSASTYKILTASGST